MQKKVREMNEAIRLRRKGYSYREILKIVPVSKSSLSNYLKDLPLTNSERIVLKRRKNSNITKGRIMAAHANHTRRLDRDNTLYRRVAAEFEARKDDPYFQLGIGLYWAEGSKRNSSFGFTNSDVEMARIMLAWILKYLPVQKSEIFIRLYVHHKFHDQKFEETWSGALRVPLTQFKKTVIKPNTALIKRRPNYIGCIRIELGKITHLRTMLFWQKLLVEYYA